MLNLAVRKETAGLQMFEDNEASTMRIPWPIRSEMSLKNHPK
jgi:hypothetical protein